MALGLLDAEVDGGRRLGADDEVDVILAAQAVRNDAHARVGVGGEAARGSGDDNREHLLRAATEVGSK